MKDRVPLYPGRVKLTPVAGQSDVYDMTRADQPTQAGDPINKATLLKDATAALFGLGTDAVPDDVLAKLAGTALIGYDVQTESPNRLTDMLGNTILNLPAVQIATGSYVGTGTAGSDNPNTLTFGFVAKLVIVFLSGTTWAMFINNNTSENKAVSATTNYGNNAYTFSGNSVSWYANSSNYQLNGSGTDYYYIAIG